jgi:hypothetical protein
MSDTHQAILDAIEAYKTENSKFEEKEVKVSCARARAALGDLSKLVKIRRKELQEKKNSLTSKK